MANDIGGELNGSLTTREAEAEILSIIRSCPEGFVMRSRPGLNPCTVLHFIGFMTAVTFAEGSTWEEVLTRLRLDPRVRKLQAEAAARSAEDLRRLEAARDRNATQRARFSRRHR